MLDHYYNNYEDVIYDICSDGLSNIIELVQHQSCITITGAYKKNYLKMLSEYDHETLE